MLDNLSKADLQKAQADLSNHVDPLVVAHAAAGILRALLAEEIGKRPDEAKPEQDGQVSDPPPDTSSDEETPSRRRGARA